MNDLKEKISKLANTEIRNYLENNGYTIFFENVALSDGTKLISLSSNTEDAVLTRKNNNGKFKSVTLNDVDVTIIGEVINAINNGQIKPGYGWICKDNVSEYYSSSFIPFVDEKSAFVDMVEDAMDFAQSEISNNLYNGVYDINEVKVEAKKGEVKVNWLTYKVVKFG